MPVPSPRNSIRIARGNFADLNANAGAFGEGEFIYAIDQDRFYTAAGGSLVAVGAGTVAVESIDRLADVDTSTVPPGVGQVLKWDGAKWVPADDSNTDAVTSVAGKTGAVTLVKADITDFSGADYATAAQGTLADGAVQSAGDTMTGALGMPVGSAASPSVYFDANTGIYSPGADQVAISTNGTGRLFVDASGRAGIGADTPLRRLHVNTSTDTDNVILGSAGTGLSSYLALNADGRSDLTGALMLIDYSSGIAEINNRSNQALIFGTNNTERMRLTSDGRLGLGSSSPSESLQIGQNGSGTDNYIALWGDQSGSNAEFAGIKFFNNQANGSSSPVKQVASLYAARDGDNFGGALYFQTANISSGSQTLGTRMVLDSSGRLGIGATSVSAKLDVVETFATSALLVRHSGATGGGAAINVTNGQTSTTPIYGFYYNGTTGIGNPAANVISAIIDGTERGRWDSSGRFLVGTSSVYNVPTGDGGIRSPGLQRASTTFADSSISSTLFNTATEGGGTLTLSRSNTTTLGAQAIAASQDATGSIWFSASDGVTQIPTASIVSRVDGTPGVNDMPGRLVFSTTADGASSPTERMSITSNGSFVFDGSGNTNSVATGSKAHINQTATGPVLYIAATGGIAAFLNRNVSDGSVLVFRRSNTEVGSVSVTTTATAYNTSSDYRLKENVTPVTDGITRLQQLKPSRFNFIADPAKTVDGFIAHEVQDVVPEAISGEKDAVDADGKPIYQGIDQSKLVPLLTAALQEALAEIESLKARVTALEP